MRFLSVAQRELRCAAQNRRTYYTRCFTAAAFLAFLIWLIWVSGGFSRKGMAGEIFAIYSHAIFFYCLIIGTALTADAISSERRDGTLGLLFLTNLSSFEIVAGKVCSRALAVLYGIVAIFPMLALPFLMGGITFEHFWRTVFALLNGIYFSVAVGFVASVLCVRQFTAIATALGLALFIGTGPMIEAAITNEFPRFRWAAEILAAACPLYGLTAADGSPVFGGNHFWISLGSMAGASTLWLAFVVWRTAHVWQDRPKSPRAANRSRFFQRLQEHRSAGRSALRRRLLQINPFFWLSSRQRVSAPVFMLVIIVAISFTSLVTGPYFGRAFRAGAVSPLIGQLFAWFWAGLVLHALVLYYAAMISSRRLAEDKQSGALELILSTPTNERQISRGLWLGFARRMFFPALAVVLVHFFFTWIGATLIVMEPPTRLPGELTPGRLLWLAAFQPSMLGPRGGWEYRFMLQIILSFLAVMIAAWIALGWIGRWLGLRMKHPGFAPIVSLALLFVPYVLMCSLVIYTAGELRLYRMPERHFLPLMTWVLFGIGAGHCAALSLWASRQLRNHFRSTVTSRFQPREPRRWLPRPRTVMRFSLRALGAATAIALLVFGFYAYQNWRGQRAWVAFQNELKQKGESLDAAKTLPAGIPDGENFARSAPFQSVLSDRKSGVTKLLDKTKSFDFAPYGNQQGGMEWAQQEFAPLDDRVLWFESKSNKAAGTNFTDYAVVILRGLKPHERTLHALAAAARMPHFQIAANPPSSIVLSPNRLPIEALERLHFLLQVRACASLAVGRTNDASEDLNCMLRLTQLARELPDAESSLRAQTLAVRSLQPLWEGLVRHQWNNEQLVSFQTQLTGFNFLTDHTNAIRRVVLAHIAVWREVAATNTYARSLPIARGAFIEREEWRFQPRAWWFDLCAQLYRAGETAIQRVDFAANRISLDYDWESLNGLPLGSETMQLLQQGSWFGANPSSVAFAQTAVNQAVIACALERFHLANGRFPESLDELIPRFLDHVPFDLIRGRPVIYQPADDGRYILRAVGPNGNDDRKSKSSDDWLWSYGTNTPPAVRIMEGN
jgi:ABC-type transport system involved in cytochrome c biogenesis permease component